MATHGTQEANPYASPLVAADAAARVGFRWRIIPTVLAGLYALSAAIGGFVGAGIAIVGFVSGQVDGDRLALIAGVTTGALLVAILWFAASQCWWRGRWWRAVLLTALASVPGVVAACLLEG